MGLLENENIDIFETIGILNNEVVVWLWNNSVIAYITKLCRRELPCLWISFVFKYVTTSHILNNFFLRNNWSVVSILEIFANSFHTTRSILSTRTRRCQRIHVSVEPPLLHCFYKQITMADKLSHITGELKNFDWRFFLRDDSWRCRFVEKSKIVLKYSPAATMCFLTILTNDSDTLTRTLQRITCTCTQSSMYKHQKFFHKYLEKEGQPFIVRNGKSYSKYECLSVQKNEQNPQTGTSATISLLTNIYLTV